jgi:hypothetical protein
MPCRGRRPNAQRGWGWDARKAMQGKRRGLAALREAGRRQSPHSTAVASRVTALRMPPSSSTASPGIFSRVLVDFDDCSARHPASPDLVLARLEEFSLSLHPDKTRLIEFGRATPRFVLASSAIRSAFGMYVRRDGSARYAPRWTRACRSVRCVTADDYATNLEANLLDLLDRIKSGRYKAPPRLARYGLTLHPAKTRFVDFRNNRPNGTHHPETDGTRRDSHCCQVRAT